ncbi:NAD(P)-binding protein [Xylariaceae sp. FL0804]|nr:NAD(P)-binding protein [Xylariaceae sp. FL0804]
MLYILPRGVGPSAACDQLHSVTPITNEAMPQKVVLVTGANKGLGLATIKVASLRSPGAVYILCSRDAEKGEKARQELMSEGVQDRVDVLQLDVTDDAQIVAAAKYVEETYGHLDILVNNAGFVRLVRETDLTTVRNTFNQYMNVHVTSVAVVSYAFKELLRRSPAPKVINVTSSLGSITNTLSKPLPRVPGYGASKVGMNGCTAHMQMAEDEKFEKLASVGTGGDGQQQQQRIRYFIANPGPVKTALSSQYGNRGKEPEDGAEVIVRLMADEGGEFDRGMQWEFSEGTMREVPW